jgi:hypothetical protein
MEQNVPIGDLRLFPLRAPSPTKFSKRGNRKRKGYWKYREYYTDIIAFCVASSCHKMRQKQIFYTFLMRCIAHQE